MGLWNLGAPLLDCAAQAAELAKINIELERSNNELDALPTSLPMTWKSLTRNSSFLIEDYADVLNVEGVSKLQTMMRLTQRMEDLIESLLFFLVWDGWNSRCRNQPERISENVIVLSISLKDTKVDIRIPRPYL